MIERSDQISTPEEAREYYAAKLAGAHKVTCHGRPVTIVFEAWATHLFTIEPPKGEAIPANEIVRRQIPGGRVEDRRFSLDRARLMDHVLPAITKFTVSTPGTSNSTGREKRMLHGPRLSDGRYLRVVLRPGPGEAFTCVSAYPVDQRVWLDQRRAKSAKFPP